MARFTRSSMINFELLRAESIFRCKCHSESHKLHPRKQSIISVEASKETQALTSAVNEDQ